MTIQNSMDYGSFSLSPYRRKVSDRSIESLTNEIEFRNLLAYYPIIVDENNVILDGQRRFLSAVNLGLPIRFIRAEKRLIPYDPYCRH